MKAASLPANEVDRLTALRAYEILDTLYETQFDALTRLAASICKVPISLISLVDKDRQWFKSVVGLAEGVRETSRDLAFCAHAIHGTELFEVSDAHEDSRFLDNPLVTGSPHVRYYAGVPLIDSQGYALGTLCVIDHVPRSRASEQKAALAELAGLAVSLMEARKVSLRAHRAQKALSAEVEMAQHYMDRLLRSSGLDRRSLRRGSCPHRRLPNAARHALRGDALLNHTSPLPIDHAKARARPTATRPVPSRPAVLNRIATPGGHSAPGEIQAAAIRPIPTCW